MKSILMSIQSKWLCEILNGRKTAELRKRFPKDYRGWVYLYCTKAKPYLIGYFGRYFITDYLDPEVKDGLVKNGLVVARVWVEKIDYVKNCDAEDIIFRSCLTLDEIQAYGFSVNLLAIEIAELAIFKKPKELNDFSVDHSAKWHMPIKAPITKAPQSWQYIYIEEEKL